MGIRKPTSKMHLVIAAVIVSFFGFCPDTSGEVKKGQQAVDDSILASYRQYGTYTDPGEYVSSFRNLPESLADLCDLIKAQLIHPFVDLFEFEDVIPEDRYDEDAKYPSVKTMLKGLLEYDPRGLVSDRKPEHRLVVTCRYHAILFASILKSRGIPVRVRYGFAPYIAPGVHIYHVICEVWNDEESRWMLVDPGQKMVDFQKDQFEFANDVWLKYRKGEIYPGTYGILENWGPPVIIDILCHDVASVLGTEHLYWDSPPVVSDCYKNVDQLSEEQVAVLNRVATLLQTPEQNRKELQELYDTHVFLQFP